MKKGSIFTVQAVVGILIGLVCVTILVLLSVGLYNLFIQPGVTEQAKGSFNQIVLEIESLKDGEDRSYVVLNPIDWLLMSDGKKFCMCDSEAVKEAGDNFLAGDDSIKSKRKFTLCTRGNICKDMSVELEIVSSCTFGHTLSLNCLNLRSLPMTLHLIKEVDKVRILSGENLKVEKDLRNVLDYKIAEGSVNDLVLKLLSADSDNRIVLRERLKEVLNEYFESFDSMDVFEVDKKNFVYSFKILDVEDDENPWIIIVENSYPDASSFVLGSAESKLEVNYREYVINLGYYRDDNLDMKNLNI